MDENPPGEGLAHCGARTETTPSGLMGPSEPLILIGYWAEPGHPDSPYPDPRDLVDRNQPREERNAIVDYLTRGLLARAYMGRSTCRICGDPANGNLELTDGIFLWPEGLAHYVRDHDVRLPTAFVEHVDQRTTDSRAGRMMPRNGGDSMLTSSASATSFPLIHDPQRPAPRALTPKQRTRARTNTRA